MSDKETTEVTKRKRTRTSREMAYVGGAGLLLFAAIYAYSVNKFDEIEFIESIGTVIANLAGYWTYLFIALATGHSARHWGAAETSGKE